MRRGGCGCGKQRRGRAADNVLRSDCASCRPDPLASARRARGWLKFMSRAGKRGLRCGDRFASGDCALERRVTWSRGTAPACGNAAVHPQCRPAQLAADGRSQRPASAGAMAVRSAATTRVRDVISTYDGPTLSSSSSRRGLDAPYDAMAWLNLSLSVGEQARYPTTPLAPGHRDPRVHG